ncbi:MAG: DEAD/DEAH box helicase [Gammaproteobacteria bacterium]|nr:DEAD/DEAH box helicase [Gammaproteobacteria bacterium]
MPAVSFPAELPISAHVDEIAALIDANAMVVVAGETGSGKSTQLPKVCLGRGRELPGMVAHTQPRRIAAREVASRIASEIGCRLGDAVGYKVRFGERTSAATRVKVLTDGMLLAEMERDRDLAAYHTVIVDEAHERSVNIDFILGYLKRLVARRPELRVVVTSATIDTARFARHFDDCPVLEVSGRTFAVETRYRPIGADEEADALPAAVAAAAAELWREGPGDILVFLPGEREIREVGAFLAPRLGDDVEILPLYARLSPADQKRIFRPSRGRRVVLATNVAETSLTVPGGALRRRQRTGAREPLQRRAQGAAASRGAHLARRCRAAQGALRAGARRHLHPAVLRGGLRLAPRVHRPGNPPHLPRIGGAEDEGVEPRRGRRVPLHRAARPAPGALGRAPAARDWRPRRRRAADAGRTPSRLAAGGAPHRPPADRGSASALPRGDAGHRLAAVHRRSAGPAARGARKGAPPPREFPRGGRRHRGRHRPVRRLAGRGERELAPRTRALVPVDVPRARADARVARLLRAAAVVDGGQPRVARGRTGRCGGGGGGVFVRVSRQHRRHGREGSISRRRQRPRSHPPVVTQLPQEAEMVRRRRAG